jgi:hypothetical protein
MNQFRAGLLILFCILTASGCAGSTGRASAGDEPGAFVILSSLYSEGLGQSAGAMWVDNEKELLSVMEKINRRKIGGSPTMRPAIDYGQEGVIAVWMGIKSTGGYRIELASDKISVGGSIAILKVRWIEPDKNAVLTQAITSPCILIRLARYGFSRIQVVDQNGIIRAETTVEGSQK